MSGVPSERVRVCNQAPANGAGEYVLYWMTAQRRATSSFALDRAVGHARSFGKPLVVLEALRAGYPWASDRLHRFVLEGMADNAAAFPSRGVTYLPYVEARPGAGRGLLEAVAARACVVVTDDSPAFFLPRMLAAAAHRVPVRLEAVDGNGIMPLAAVPNAFPTAYAFRRFLQAKLPVHLELLPEPDPFAGAPLPRLRALPPELERWPAASTELLRGDGAALAGLPIDHHVAPVPGTRGGAGAGRAVLARFVRERLHRYADGRNHPDPEQEAASGLSPYLHFGHIGAHEVLAAVAAHEGWNVERLGAKANGKRTGWWGMSRSAEAFLDQLVTWRELGFGFSARREDHDDYEALPPWALATLEKHAGDPRPHRYAVEALAAAATHDPLWNAAQRQLLRDGRIHNYLRMLWGKKIVEWSPSPREALAAMLELNNRWALDGRDPNSTSGISWCLGRFDRPWGPERPIFGTVRYMSSENTARKLDLAAYLRSYGR